MIRIFLLLFTLLLFHCTHKPKYLSYQNHVPVEARAVHNVKAKMSLVVQNQKEIESVNASIWTIPGKQTRIELYGPLGISVASVLWVEGNWTVLIPREKKYSTGFGDNIHISLFNHISIHDLIQPLWGELLDSGWQNAQRVRLDSNLIELNWGQDSITYKANMDSTFGKIYWQSKTEYDKTLLKKYSDYQSFEKQYLPSKIKLELSKSAKIHVKLKNVETNIAINDKIWALEIPSDFQKVYFY